jgi:hypothetical protein
MANSFLCGGWHALVNGYWSPAYPFLLACELKLFRPGLFHHFLAMNLLSFISLVAALVCFEYFLSSFFAFRKQLASQDTATTGELISDDAVWLIGYSLFFWVTTFFTPASLQHPDILVFIACLLVSALSMQLFSRHEWWRYAALGVVLGFGYLAKSVMFPLAFAFLLALYFQNRRPRAFARILVAFAVFLAVSLPYVLTLSHRKGRLTFSDVGTVAYRHIMGFDSEPLPHTLIARPAATPHIQDYSKIIDLGTYPPLADPSHAFKGAPFQFNLRRQLNRTHVVSSGYFEVYLAKLGVLAAALLIFLFFDSPVSFFRPFLNLPVLWLPALAGLAFYASMRFENRFLGGFTLALFAAFIGSVRMTDTQNGARLTRSVALAVSLLLFAQAGMQAGHDAIKLIGHAPDSDQQVATALRQMGIGHGDLVAYMGYALTDHAWAYLAEAKIIAEIPSEDTPNFWATDAEQRTKKSGLACKSWFV